MRLLIIGCGAGGFAAALTAKKLDRSIDITIVDDKSYSLLHHCGLPYYIEGIIGDVTRLTQHIDFERMGISYLPNSKVLSVDTANKTVKTNEKELSYDRLIIATGSSPLSPPIPGIENALFVHDENSARDIRLRSQEADKAVVIGAGAIGLETAYALARNNVDVTVIDMLPWALPRQLDHDIASRLQGFLEQKGIRFMFNTKITEIRQTEVVSDKGSIGSSLTIMAAGIKPNIDFLEGSGIEYTNRGIKVDEFLNTTAEDVFAIGDIIDYVSLIDNKPFQAQLASTAYIQGVTAAANVLGKGRSYRGSLGTFVTKIGPLEIAATGFSTETANGRDIKAVSMSVKANTRPEWFPDGKEIALKLVADKEGRLIGAQAIGQEGAAARINVLSAAIQSRMTVRQLTDLELAYCPSVSQTTDVITIAAELLSRKLSR